MDKVYIDIISNDGTEHEIELDMSSIDNWKTMEENELTQEIYRVVKEQYPEFSPIQRFWFY